MKNARAIKAKLSKRDGWKCAYCGVPFQRYTDATVDHVNPLSNGGKSTLDNLKLACEPCNGAKGDSLIWQYLNALVRRRED